MSRSRRANVTFLKGVSLLLEEEFCLRNFFLQKEISRNFLAEKFLRNWITRPKIRKFRTEFSARKSGLCTQRNLSEMLLNQIEIRLYLPCTDWFWTANGRLFAVPNQLGNGKYNLISVWFTKISERFLCVCTLLRDRNQIHWNVILCMILFK